MMLRRSVQFLCLLTSTPVLWALGPDDIANKTIRLDMSESQVARADMYQEPELPWYQLDDITDFVIDFPETGKFTTPVTYGIDFTDEVKVSYDANAEANQAYIKVESDDLRVLVELTYTSNTGGTATIAWHQAGDTRWFRRVSFTVQDDFDVASRVELPEEIISTSPEPVLNDGLSEILSRLQETRYRSASDKLYQKRLLSLLPMVMMLDNASWTTPDYKGNTALHYACNLGDIELVRWLVEHGADLQATTDKGAWIDDCIGGKNGPAIKAIIQKARAWRDQPYTGPAVDKTAARQSAAWLNAEFEGEEMAKPEYDVSIDEPKVREAAQLVYRYTKQNGTYGLGIDLTSTLGVHLVSVINGKVSEDMFLSRIMREMKQIRLVHQRRHRCAGLTLAKLPHMIMVRENEGMPLDGATAVYRAASEGNVELVRWLTSMGADRRLRDAEGKPATLPADTPNLAEIQEALNMHD